ncbi:Ead domain protein [Klebsiella pneumoniae]|nr:Ead domain protein [Klebsiella pneumoniae]
MTDITELAQSLKAAAEKAGADAWQAKKISGDYYVIRKGSYKRECGYTTYQPIAEIDHKPTRDFVAMANPTNILALVEALERKEEQRANWFQMAQKLGEDLDSAEKRIAELESRLESADKLQDSAFRSGLQHGFSLGQTDDQKGYEQSMAAYSLAAGIKVEAE